MPPAVATLAHISLAPRDPNLVLRAQPLSDRHPSLEPISLRETSHTRSTFVPLQSRLTRGGRGRRRPAGGGGWEEGEGTHHVSLSDILPTKKCGPASHTFF